MSLYNSDNFYDDEFNDDFDVDFSDSIEEKGSSSKTKKTKSVTKDTKKAPKKQITVDTKKPKKKKTVKTAVKKTVKPKIEEEVEPKPEKKEEKIKVVKRSSKDKKTTKKVVKESKKTVQEEDEEILEPKEEIKPQKKIEKEEPLIEEKKVEPLKEEIKEEKPAKKEFFDDLEDVEVELEEIEEEKEEAPAKKETIEPKKKKEPKVVVEAEEIEEEFTKSYKSEEELYDVPIRKVLKVKFKKLFRKLKNYKKQLIIAGAVLFVLITGFVIVKLGIVNISFNSSRNAPVIVQDDDILEEYRKTWQSYEEINSDYVGQIVFDSQLINKPFVQATSCYKENGVPYKFYNQNGSVVADFSDKTGNDVYIWMDFETMQYDYDNKGGSIFMDYRNVLSDQNLIIYGHYFSTIYNKDPDRVKSFTPLEKLLEKENYKDNSRVYIVLEDEIRTYDLYAVYKFDSESDEYWDKAQYFRPNYNVDDFTGEKDADYMKNYIKFIDEVKLYKTNVTLEPGDKTLTLQTCMTPSTTLYEICVFKQVDVTKY